MHHVEARVWAKGRGLAVSKRGRVSFDVLEAFYREHPAKLIALDLEAFKSLSMKELHERKPEFDGLLNLVAALQSEKEGQHG